MNNLNSVLLDFDRVLLNSDSTNVDLLAYSFTKEMMRVDFSSGHSYCYYQVKIGEWNKIITSDSIGSELKDTVTRYPDKYPYEKITTSDKLIGE